MTRLSIYVICVAIAVLVFSGVGVCAQTDLKQISDSGFTVSYPEGMEAQATRIMAIAKTSFTPSLDVQRQMVSLLSDTDSLAGDIAMWLGQEGTKHTAKARLDIYKSRSQTLIRCFTNIRLVKAGDAAADGLDAGVVRVVYDRDTNDYKMGINSESTDQEVIDRSYFPVLVNADGTVQKEDKLGSMGIGFMGSSKAMIVAPVHEVVGYIVAEDLKLYYPFARWFNEGVSGWVTRQVVIKANPALTKLTDELMSPSASAKKLKDKINFAAWPQAAYQNPRQPDFDPALEAAQTQYAIQAISDLASKYGSSVVPKIVGYLSYSANADNDEICAAIQKATGADFKPVLKSYIPQDIRDAERAGEPKKLIAKAEKQVGQKQWLEARETLRRELEMTPQDVNTRLNLAWLDRETSQNFDAELQILLTARLLKQQKYSFHMLAPTIEGQYVMGRLSILIGDIESAKKSLQTVLQIDPQHKDAQRALEEIKTLENTARGE